MSLSLIETIRSKSGRFYAELFVVEGIGRYKAHYYGPNNADRGERDHTGNLNGVKEGVKRQLAELDEEV